MKAKLVVIKGAQAATIKLLRLPTVIGRSAEATLTVPTTKVSRKHCELFEDDETLMIRDLGSTNGTFVNKEKIEGDTALSSGDLIKVGPIVLRAVYEEKTPPPEEDSFIGLGEEPPSSDESGGLSVVEYKETPDGSFIDIGDESPQEEKPKQAQKLKQAVKQQPAEPQQDKDQKQGKKDEGKKAVEKKEAASSSDSDIFSDLPEAAEAKTVESGDSALNDFFKSLE